MITRSERRKHIEGEMVALVVQMHKTICDVEDVMLAGYNGRAAEIKPLADIEVSE